MNVNTVLGPIASENLGQTLMHEHISCADWSMRMNFGDKFMQYDKVVDMAVGQLKKLRDCGVTTFVDGTAINLGRDIRLMRDVAAASGMNIIASSGFYYQEEPWLAFRDEGEIRDLLLDECITGMAGTDSLPGMMKNGVVEAGVTPLQQKLLHAVGTVAVKANLPVFCHHVPDTKTGYEILKVYDSVGLATNRVILGHTGDGNDWAYQRALVSSGAYIGFDRLAYGDRNNSVENCVKNIIMLAEAGYLNRVFLSHDWATYLAFWDSWETTSGADYLNLPIDFTLVSTQVIPMLRAAGLSADDIRTVMVDNPRNFFEGN